MDRLRCLSHEVKVWQRSDRPTDPSITSHPPSVFSDFWAFSDLSSFMAITPLLLHLRIQQHLHSFRFSWHPNTTTAYLPSIPTHIIIKPQASYLRPKANHLFYICFYHASFLQYIINTQVHLLRPHTFVSDFLSLDFELSLLFLSFFLSSASYVLLALPTLSYFVYSAFLSNHSCSTPSLFQGGLNLTIYSSALLTLFPLFLHPLARSLPI